MEENTCIDPDNLFAGAANRVDFSGSSYHKLVRIQTNFNHPEATIQSPIEAQCKGFNPNVNLLINSTFRQLQKVQEGRVVLKIGGRCFHTSMVTLGAEPNSILGLLSVSDCPMRPHRNCYNFDRDPAHFKLILNYLLNGAHLEMLTLPHEKQYLLELLTEARFFCVQGLVKILIVRLEQVTKSRDFLTLEFVKLAICSSLSNTVSKFLNQYPKIKNYLLLILMFTSSFSLSSMR